MNKPSTERKVGLWQITSGLKIYFSPGRFGCSYRGNSGWAAGCLCSQSELRSFH